MVDVSTFEESSTFGVVDFRLFAAGVFGGGSLSLWWVDRTSNSVGVSEVMLGEIGSVVVLYGSEKDSVSVETIKLELVLRLSSTQSTKLSPSCSMDIAVVADVCPCVVAAWVDLILLSVVVGD